MKKMFLIIILIFLSVIVLSVNSLESLYPIVNEDSVEIDIVAKSEISEESVIFQSNPSKTVYSLSLEDFTGSDMNLPFRGGDVEGLWTRQYENKYSVDVALLLPPVIEPEIIIEGNTIKLKFFDIGIGIDIDRFSTYGMYLEDIISYIFNEVLDMSYVISNSVSSLPVSVGFTSEKVEDVLRNVLVSLGDKIGYAYLTDGTFYIANPDEISNLVNSFWKTYTGVDIIDTEGDESVEDQIKRIREELPINSYIEYLPNDSSILAFGDLRTHLVISSALSISTKQEIYTVPEVPLSETVYLGMDLYDKFVSIAKNFNSLFFNNEVEINELSDFNQILIDGESEKVDKILSYLSLFEEMVLNGNANQQRKMITIELPENYKIVEDVINNSKDGMETDEKTLVIGKEELTYVDLIVKMVELFLNDTEIIVDKSFEGIRSITFGVPSFAEDVFKEIVEDLKEKSMNIDYSFVNSIEPFNEDIFESVRQITGIIIEPLGENSFILKGDKSTIKIARDMIEQFSNTLLKLFKYTYYELPDGESFETAEKILENYFVFKGLGEDDYTLDLTGDNLLYVVAPENYLDEAVSQLDYYKPYITSKVYKDIVPTYKEIIVEFSNDEIKNLITQLSFQVEVLDMGDRRIIIGPEDQVTELDRILRELSKMNETQQETNNSSETTTTDSTKTTTDIPVSSSKTFVVVENLVDVNSLDPLFKSMNVEVEFIPLESKTVMYGTEYDVNRANSIYEQVGKLFVKEGKTFFLMELVPGTDIDKVNDLLKELEIDAQISQIEGQLVIIGLEEEALKAKELIDSIKDNIDPDIDQKYYEITQVPTYTDIDNLNESLKQLNINAEIIKVQYEKSLDSETETTISSSDTESESNQYIKSSNYSYANTLSVMVVGTKDGVTQAMELLNGLTPKEEEKILVVKTFKIIEERTSITILEMKDLFERLGIGVEGIEIGGKKVLIGTEEEIGKGEEVLKGFVIEGEEEKEKSYEVIAGGIIDEGEVTKVKEVAEKTGIEIEIISIDGKIVLIGTTNDISATKGIITEINKEGEKEAEEYEILEKIGLSGTEANTLIEQTGLGIKVEEVGGKIVLVGVRGEIEKAKEILSKFEVEEEETESEKTYKTVKTPAGFIKEEIEKILSSLGIGAEIVETGEIMVITGTEEEVEKAGSIIEEVDRLSVKEEGKELKYEVVEGEGVELAKVTEALGKLGIPAEIVESGTKIMIIGSEDEIEDTKEIIKTLKDVDVQVDERVYEIIDVPGNVVVDDLLNAVNMSEYNFKYSILKNRILVYGDKKDVLSVKDLIEKFIPIIPEKEESDVMFVEYINGINAELIKTYLDANNLNDVDVFAIQNGYLIIGSKNEIEDSKKMIDFIKSKVEKEYLVINIPKGFDKITLDELITNEDLNVNLIVLTDENALVNGDKNDIKKLEEILALIPESEENEVEYKLIDIKEEIDISEINALLKSLNYEVEISKIGNSEIIIGDATNTSGSFEVLDDLKFLSEAPLKEIIEYFKPEYIAAEDLLNILNSTYGDGVTFEAFASLNMIIIKSYDEEKIGEIIEFSENLDEEAKLSDKLINNIEIKDDSISVNLKDQNVEELLKYISEEMQESLVFSNVIDEEITLNVKDISWVGLLDIISLTKPVEYEVIDGTYFVKKIQEDELAGDTSEQIYRIYQNAQDFADLVQFYGGTAQVDELNGIVVIKGISKESVANIMNEVGDTLKNPKKQVEIESVLVDVDETVDLVKKLELYLKSDVLSVTQTTANLELGILDITNPTAVIENILMRGKVGADIEFSNTLGDAQIISSPSVVAMSGEEGRVHIGDTIPQLVPTLDASRNLEFKLEYIQSGVDLKVIPKVLDNGKISMKIYIEVSEPQAYKFYYDGKEFEYYGKNEKTFESNLVISDGNTLVIGGLKRQDTKKTTKKTPGLSDLPFLGALFKPNDTLTDNNRTLTIFLTARIIEP